MIVAMFVYAAIVWGSAPDQIPVHWNLEGTVDRYGGKLEGMLLLPIAALGIYLLLLVIPRIDPGRANYKSFAKTYTIIRVSVTLMMAIIYVATQLAIFKFSVNMGMFVCCAVGIFFLLLGNVMGKIRPNWFVGIRTPWTLSSHLSWNKTHRLGGWLFMLQGLMLIGVGVISTPWALGIMLTTVLGSVAFLVVYSYFVWRSDPNPVSIQEISPAPDEKGN